MNKSVATTVERIDELAADDLEAILEATNQAIMDGLAFGWLRPQSTSVLETYWRGTILVPERELHVARLDGQIVGGVQLVRPTRSNEVVAHIADVSSFFIAPWARGIGLARGLLQSVEKSARDQGFLQLEVSVRDTQLAVIELYTEFGFKQWGRREKYALIEGRYVDGIYFYKEIAKPARHGS